VSTGAPVAVRDELEPDPLVVGRPDVGVAAAVGAGTRASNARTPALPATVAVRTMGDRRMSEGEGLEVDAVAGHAGALQLAGEPLPGP
jgi:hypothetical protein